jgi:hypothetical protein
MERSAGESVVTLAKVRLSGEHVPNGVADFETANAIGRVNAWVSGHVDFEILNATDGDPLFSDMRRCRLCRIRSLKSVFGLS